MTKFEAYCRDRISNGIEDLPWYEELKIRSFFPIVTLLTPNTCKTIVVGLVGISSSILELLGRTLVPNWMVVTAIMVAIAVDLVTARIRIVRSSDENWSKSWGRMTVYKVVEYLAAYWFAVAVDNALLGGMEIVSRMTAALIVYNEGESIEQNWYGEDGPITRVISNNLLSGEEPESDVDRSYNEVSEDNTQNSSN